MTKARTTASAVLDMHVPYCYRTTVLCSTVDTGTAFIRRPGWDTNPRGMQALYVQSNTSRLPRYVVKIYCTYFIVRYLTEAQSYVPVLCCAALCCGRAAVLLNTTCYYRRASLPWPGTWTLCHRHQRQGISGPLRCGYNGNTTEPDCAPALGLPGFLRIATIQRC